MTLPFHSIIALLFNVPRQKERKTKKINGVIYVIHLDKMVFYNSKKTVVVTPTITEVRLHKNWQIQITLLSLSHRALTFWGISYFGSILMGILCTIILCVWLCRSKHPPLSALIVQPDIGYPNGLWKSLFPFHERSDI